MPISLREHIQEILPEIVALRHDLHQHPEIRFEEHWTSDRIARFLQENGIAHTRGHAKGTGIVAEVAGEGSACIVLRADIDALEIAEKTGLPYASTIPDRMHACGHDGHSANLCGVAKLLRARREELRGTVRFIFQPAEEQAAGGRYIVDEGLLDGAGAAFALHCWPGIPCGQAAIGDGHVMASADYFRISIRGRGGHGADPAHAVDPIVVAAHIVTALQTLVSRETDPWHAGVVSVGAIHAGLASNIIPETAEMEGTFRALLPKVRAHLCAGIERVATDMARAFRAEAVVTFGESNYPPVNNDPAMAAFVRDTLATAMGSDAVYPVHHPYMTAEDFAFYLDTVPGAFIFLGNDAPDEADSPSLHSPHFNFNDAALPTGMELMARLAIDFLAQR